MRKKIVIFKTIVVFMSMFLHAVIHFCDGALWSFWMEANLCSFCMLSFIFVMVHCGLFEWKRIFAVVVVICCYLYCRWRSNYQTSDMIQLTGLTPPFFVPFVAKTCISDAIICHILFFFFLLNWLMCGWFFLCIWRKMFKFV